MRGVWDSPANASPPQHGTRRCYQYGCRHPECIAANTRYTKRLRMDHDAGNRRMVDGTGTRRRILALGCIGWSRSEIARQLGRGCTKQMVSLWVCSDRMVYATNAKAVAALYERLCMTQGPTKSAIGWSRKAGGHPPLAWDDIDTDPAPIVTERDDAPDLIAVQRAIDGHPVKVTTAERVEAVRVMAARGWSDAEMAERLRICGRSVQRIRDLHGITSTWKADAA